ncbi:hypothetical protein BKA70DRAFT_778193 [Coprinopsis sp. MPI-PUGE-AT-0042]|nr:hypothetical protein BKA70DRAFT_778193 [Coprinopsis sp. MPI-PUGE-AT-0042]
MYALYGCNRRATICWAAFSLVTLGLKGYGGVWSGIMAVESTVHPPFPGWTGCLAVSGRYQTGIIISSITAVIEALVFFIATAWKLKQHNYPLMTSMEAKFIQRLSPLSAALFQDGAFWLLAITVLSALLTLVAIYQRVYLLYVTAWIHTVSSCGASHIVLNIRGVAARQQQGSTRLQGQKSRMETLRFAEVLTPPSSTFCAGESTIPPGSSRDEGGASAEMWRRGLSIANARSPLTSMEAP